MGVGVEPANSGVRAKGQDQRINHVINGGRCLFLKWGECHRSDPLVKRIEVERRAALDNLAQLSQFPTQSLSLCTVISSYAPDTRSPKDLSKKALGLGIETI